MKTKIYIFLLVMLASGHLFAQNKTQVPKYIKVPSGYLMVLRQGDNVLKELENFAVAEQIQSANFSGMGFVNATFGFFNFKTKSYDPKTFNGVELANMLGTIAWKDGKPSSHTHGVVTDKEFNAHGGHMLEATVGTGSVEILITPHDKKLNRETEQPLGANVLNLNH